MSIAGIIGGDRSRARDLLERYLVVQAAARQELTGLAAEIKRAKEQGKTPGIGWLYRERRLARILDETTREVEVLAAELNVRLIGAKQEALTLGVADGLAQLDLLLVPPGELGVGISLMPKVPRLAVEAVAVRQVTKLSADLRLRLKNTITVGVALGRSPDIIAREVRRNVGANAARALTIARTEVLSAYRRGSTAAYKANSDLLEGWVWRASLDARTCAFCWAQHGSLHPPDDEMETHPSCRCAEEPRTKSWEALGFEGFEDTRPEVVVGSEQFAALAPMDQRRVLGPGAFEAYKAGRIKLADVVGEKGRRRSLKEMLA